MATIHKVQQGETLVDIAKQYGFVDSSTIWNDARNTALRQKRPNANLLFPGDALIIPDKQQKQESRSTGQRHQFQVRAATKVLRIALEDEEGVRFANAAYMLTIGNQTYTGTTDGQGFLQKEVPIEAQEGELRIKGHFWPLQIGHLNPVDHAPDMGVSGIQARLRNLGYALDDVTGQMDDRTRAAIRAFQADYSLAVDGKCDPNSATLAKLVQKHGC